MAQCFGTDSGQLFNRFIFNDDGTVSGYFNDTDETTLTSYGSSSITDNPVSLPKECCTTLGYTFDGQTGKCFYAEPCAEDDTVKVLFGIDQMDAFNFQVVSGETANLEIKFDYIFKYDCDTLLECGTAEANDLLSGITSLEYTRTELENQLSGYTNQFNFFTANPTNTVGFDDFMSGLQQNIGFLTNQINQINEDLDTLNTRYAEASGTTISSILSDFKATVTIDRVDPPASGTTTPVYTTVAELPLLTIGDFEEYITDNPTTGLIISCDDCGVVDSVLREELTNPSVLTDATINSDWLNFETVINDPNIISAITNENIHISIKIEDVRCKTSILVDRISVNKLSSFLDREEVYVSQCPGFDLKRLVDNKKSWVQVSETTNREYDFETRETRYSLNDSKLVVNTKELDLNVDAANAVEFDLTQYVKNNFECILTGSTTDFSELLTSDISGVMTKDELIDILTTELIDAKTRKVLSGYPTLKKFFEIYAGMVPTTCTTSNMLSVTEVDMFIDLFGDYWTDIVEQFIPATTIWGSTNIYRNTAFCADKYKYSPNTIYWGCDSISGDTIAMETNVTVEVMPPDVVPSDCNNNAIERYDNICLLKVDNGVEYLGSIEVRDGGIINTSW